MQNKLTIPLNTPSWAVAIAASVACAACGTADPTPLGSVHVKSETVVASTGGTIEVTTEDDYAPFVGTKLEIPAGALARDTKITIDVHTESLVDDEADSAGPVVEFGPDGTSFSTPVKVTLPYTGDLDEDVVRVFVRHGDGTEEIIMPEAITLDIANKRLSFEVEHFTAYHPGRGHGACAHVNCPSGQCRRGQCVPAGACTEQECSPAPGAPNYTCPDGSIAGPVCERSAAGVCGWNFVNCPTACADDRDCGPGEGCINGSCALVQEACGPNTCAIGEFCCNESCGYCASLNGGGCTEEFCGCNADSDCDSGEACVDGQCVPQTGVVCGNTTCAVGDQCCDPSCGRCAPAGAVCTQPACLSCASDADCANPGTRQTQCYQGFCI